MSKVPYDERSDSVPEKLRLLETAWRSGHFDLAMSLAESIKDTVQFDEQQRETLRQPVIGAEQFLSVDALPKPWAHWAEGWSFCKPVRLFETVGIARSREPVDVTLAVRADQATDLDREIRVARVNVSTGTLEQVACQVYDLTRRGAEFHCQLVFLADVAAHQQADYLVLYGNPLAERATYATDLHVRGEGYGLDIENHHFVAGLSRQEGQLERLVYKRQHGLELYAGGKGHGEPPGIDWAHDYVDAGHFQKLRMRNWWRCPNYEVVTGPLCVRVRRWGFPHSPVHPLFTPSRVHIDQTYVFYAGLPYFFKHGRFDVVKDVTIAAMRDDEWVFSGYSFTDTLWFDEQGKLHEGAVPADHAQKLWGVGFHHRTSHDAFIALWLEHKADNFPGLTHGGAPTLHYDGHGQLWSRYPANETPLKGGASFRQKNAYSVMAYEGPASAGQVEQLRHQLLNPLQVQFAQPPNILAARARGALARFGETRTTAPLKPAIWKALGDVHDEQLYKLTASIVDLGYVYDVREQDGVVSVLVTMPHRGRPRFDFLVTSGGGRIEPGIFERLLKVAGVRDVVVEFTWNPPWTSARLSDAARNELGLPG